MVDSNLRYQFSVNFQKNVYKKDCRILWELKIILMRKQLVCNAEHSKLSCTGYVLVWQSSSPVCDMLKYFQTKTLPYLHGGFCLFVCFLFIFLLPSNSFNFCFQRIWYLPSIKYLVKWCLRKWVALNMSGDFQEKVNSNYTEFRNSQMFWYFLKQRN